MKILFLLLACGLPYSALAYEATLINNSGTDIEVKAASKVVQSIPKNTRKTFTLDNYTAYQLVYQGQWAAQSIVTLKKDTNTVAQNTPETPACGRLNLRVNLKSNQTEGSFNVLKNNLGHMVFDGSCDDDTGGVTCYLAQGANLNTLALTVTDLNKSAKKLCKQNVKPKVYSYWTGWGSTNNIPDQNFDGLMLSFAVLRFNGDNTYTDYSASNNFNDPSISGSSNKIWKAWTTKHNKPGYISYGGGTNSEVRKYIINASDKQLENLAIEIKANVKKYQFSGIDLDFEHWWDMKERAQNEKFATQLAKFVKILRSYLDNEPDTKGKPIAIAVNWNAAGNIEGSWNDNLYAGTMNAYFKDKAAMQATAHVMIMAYNLCEAKSDPNRFTYANLNKVEKMLHNFEQAGVAKDKLVFGIQARECGTPYNDEQKELFKIVTPLDDVKKLSGYITQNGYGGLFMWAIGDGVMNGALPAASYIAAMKGETPPPTPPEPAPGNPGSITFKNSVDATVRLVLRTDYDGEISMNLAAGSSIEQTSGAFGGDKTKSYKLLYRVPGEYKKEVGDEVLVECSGLGVQQYNPTWKSYTINISRVARASRYERYRCDIVN